MARATSAQNKRLRKIKEASGALDRDPTLRVRAGHDLTPRGLHPWPPHPGFLCGGPPGALEEASSKPSQRRDKTLRPGPAPGKGEKRSHVELPVRCVRGHVGSGRCRPAPRRLNRPTGWNGSTRNRSASDRTVEPLPPKRPPLARRSLLRPEPGHVRPGCPPRDASRLPPGTPPSGEGTDTGIERRAPEGVEVVPEALLSSSATADPLRNRCPPGLSGRCASNRTSSARRVPGRSFSEGPKTDNNNRQVKPKFLLTKFRNLHIPRTKYPPVCPQLLIHSVWISGAMRHDRSSIRRPPGCVCCWRIRRAGRAETASAALTARRQAV